MQPPDFSEQFKQPRLLPSQVQIPDEGFQRRCCLIIHGGLISGRSVVRVGIAPTADNGSFFLGQRSLDACQSLRLCVCIDDRDRRLMAVMQIIPPVQQARPGQQIIDRIPDIRQLEWIQAACIIFGHRRFFAQGQRHFLLHMPEKDRHTE